MLTAHLFQCPYFLCNLCIIAIFHVTDIDDHINRKELRGWLKAGDKGYKVLTSLSKEKLENFIVEELKIAKDKFQIVTHNEFWPIGRW